MPYVSGFASTASTDVPIRFNAEPDGDDGGLAVDTNDGTLQATYHGGVTVRDRSGAVVARAPGFVDTGSADDLEALAIGDARLGFPVIALAVTMGGHRVSTTSLVLYAIGDERQLDELLSVPIEMRDGDEMQTGSIVFAPRYLLYRAPGDLLPIVYRFDPHRRAYVAPNMQPQHPESTTDVNS
jgi:hypothetical protein